jgi:hypothetical protein
MRVRKDSYSGSFSREILFLSRIAEEVMSMTCMLYNLSTSAIGKNKVLEETHAVLLSFYSAPTHLLPIMMPVVYVIFTSL